MLSAPSYLSVSNTMVGLCSCWCIRTGEAWGVSTCAGALVKLGFADWFMGGWEQDELGRENTGVEGSGEEGSTGTGGNTCNCC